MIDKTYDPKQTEPLLYDAWEGAGAFEADVNSSKLPYTIMMPPPNVTGSLHMGHALTFTIQDILIRYQRMRGRDALWQPGTDHAGIATQMVVERQLAEQGINRRDLGREGFLEKVWQWKAESGGTITRQLRALGASPDWRRERFTMDAGLSEAVRKVFVDLYNQGLIYRDKRLVNWDPKLQTAISDLEVEQREVQGKLWYFKYPLENRPGEFITVATTRPETMLGDSGIAVNPEDERYADLVGSHAILPLVGRRLPIVADHYSDPEKGTGAVKMTPAHDFNDFEVGRRHDLELINIFDGTACLNEAVPVAYRGLERFEARSRIIADMEAEGLLEKIEDTQHVVPHGDRSSVPIEPWLLDQWYVDAKTLAGPAIAAVEQGKTEFVPKSWENTYFEWMRNIQPWCISRQLWWGHQIPAWFGPGGTIFVANDSAQAHLDAAAHFGKDVELTQDEDVLDTWFSSGLWPFSTLGWPDQTAELERYYPGDVLVTGFDIIFFWVARMMMMGIHFMGDVPFRKVYIHALVRDAKGQKMSKSKGNVIDPLDLIDRYGTDALRFTLTAMAAQGRDIKLAESRVEGYRNFATKLWNAARFCEMNNCAVGNDFDPASVNLNVNRWIIGELSRTIDQVSGAIDAYRFNDAANALYQFIWGSFCDWYLEFTKPVLGGDDAAAQAETRETTAWVMQQALTILHPIMPYITEGLWKQFGTGRHLISHAWPDLSALKANPEADASLDWVVRLISEIRSMRSEMNVPPAARVDLVLLAASEVTAQRLAEHLPVIQMMARINVANCASGDVPPGSVQSVIDEATIALPIADVIDIDQEQARLTKDIAKQAGEIMKIEKKLGNPGFLAKAPEAVVTENQERLAEETRKRNQLQAALKRLSTL
jgi:valyl-tRNA synthetase